MLNRVAVLLCLMVVSCAGVFAQWEILNPKPAGFTCNKIIFTDAQNGFILNSNGDLIKTTDQGAHWNVVQNFPSTMTMDLKYSTGLIVGNGVLYISSDNGNTWQRKNTWFSGVQFVDIVSSDTLFLASSTGTVYRSDDRGNTWNFYAVGTYLSSIEFVNSKVGYAGGSSQYILKTIDGGATWTKIVTVNTFPSSTVAINFLDENTGFAFRGFSDLLRTSDGGATWTISQVPDELYAVYFINKTTGFGCGDDGVAYRTDDGGVTWKWIGASVRIDAYDLYSTYFFDGNTGFTVGARGRILKTTDGGTTWNTYAATYLNVNSLAVPDANTAYATVGNTVYKSDNSGQTWQQLPITSNDFIQNCYFFNRDTGIVTSSRYAYLYKTYDGGNTWKKINPYQYVYDYVTYLQFFDDKNGVMNLSSWAANILLKTNDAGETWSVLWEAKYQSEIFTKISFVNQQVAYAARGNSLYKSVDGGVTWTAL